MNRKLALMIQFEAMDKLSGSMKKIVGLSESGGRQLGKMRRTAKDLDRQLKDVRARLSSGSMQGGLIMAERELVKAIKETNIQMERRKRFLQIDGRVAKMTAQADRYKSAGQQNMMGGAGMLLPFAAIGKSAMDYDKTLALMGQKLDFNKDQTTAFGKEMLTAAKAAKQLPDNVLAGADFLASKGFKADELTATMPAIAKFGTAWDADVIDSSKAAFANFKSLKVPLNQTARALEIMGAAGKAGGFEVKDMAQHFPPLTANMATMGHTGLAAVSSLSSALQVLEAKTGDGAQAATNLGNLMTFVRTDRGIKKFQKFGIDIVAEMKKAEAAGRDPLESLIDLTNKATGGDDAKIAQLFTNQQAGAGMLALVQSADEYKKIRDQAFAAQGLTAAEFTRMSKTTSANWEGMKGAASTLAITMGTHLLPMATSAFEWIGKTTNAIADWAEQNPKTAKTLLMVVGGLGAARLGLGALQFAFGGILGPAAKAWGVFAKFRATGSVVKAMPRAARIFIMLRNASLFMAKGFMKAGAMMLANPMVLAIMAIVAVIGGAAYLIYTHWDTIKQAFWTGVAMAGDAVDWLGNKFNAGVDYVESIFTGLPAKLTNIGKMMMSGLLSAINPFALGERLLNMASNGITAFKNFLGIKSPSRLFMQMGNHLTDGLAIGVKKGEGKPIRAVGKLATGIAGAMALGANPAAAAGGGAGAGGMPPITFNITQKAGEDTDEFIRRIIAELKRYFASQSNRAYRDE